VGLACVEATSDGHGGSANLQQCPKTNKPNPKIKRGKASDLFKKPTRRRSLGEGRAAGGFQKGAHTNVAEGWGSKQTAGPGSPKNPHTECPCLFGKEQLGGGGRQKKENLYCHPNELNPKFQKLPCPPLTSSKSIIFEGLGEGGGAKKAWPNDRQEKCRYATRWGQRKGGHLPEKSHATRTEKTPEGKFKS